MHCQMANPVVQTLFLVLKAANPDQCDHHCQMMVEDVGLFSSCTEVEVAPGLTVRYVHNLINSWWTLFESHSAHTRIFQFEETLSGMPGDILWGERYIEPPNQLFGREREKEGKKTTSVHTL